MDMSQILEMMQNVGSKGSSSKKESNKNVKTSKKFEENVDQEEEEDESENFIERKGSKSREGYRKNKESTKKQNSPKKKKQVKHDIDDIDDDNENDGDDDDNDGDDRGEEVGGKKKMKSKETSILETDIDIKMVDDITKKLAKDIGTGFLDDSSDEEEEEKDQYEDDSEEDEDELRDQVLKEIRALHQASKNTTTVSKGRIKQLYLELLASGQTMLKDKGASDQFLAKLSQQELTALMDVLQMNSNELLEYFNNDVQVQEAVKNAATILNPTGNRTDIPGLWSSLTENDEDLSDSDEELENIKSKKAPRSEAVESALKVVEENIVSYTQNPAALIALCEKLTPKDQQQFLDILLTEYTPDNLQKMKKQKKEEAKAKGPSRNVSNAIPELKMDMNLVAHVFKEVLSHFKSYKRHPHKFKPLTDRLNPNEYKAFEALVKAFWDVTADQLKL